MNLRFFVVSGVGAIISALAAHRLIMGEPLFFLLFAAVVSALAIFYYFYERMAAAQMVVRRLSMRVICFLFILTELIIITSGMYVGIVMRRVYTFDSEITVVGRAIDMSYVTDDGSQVVVVLENITANGKKIPGKLRLYIDFKEITSPSSPEPGMTVTAVCTVSAARILKDDGINTFLYRNDIRYYGKTDEKSVTLAPGRASFFVAIRTAMKNALYKAMPKDMAGVAYGMLIGDTLGMSDEIIETLNISGLAHILSVSGLHVAFISTALIFVLSRLRTSNRIIFIISSLVLLFYAALCGFRGPVVRATIMCGALLLSRVLNRRFDLLSALGLSVTAILLVSPPMVFDVGFQLSCAAILGIAMLAEPISRFLVRFLRSEPLCSAIALSLSAQIGAFALLAKYFGRVGIYAVFANLIFIPVINVVFLTIFALLMLTLILPPFSFLLGLTAYPLKASLYIGEFFASLPLASVVLFSTAGILTVYYLTLALSGRYVVLRRRQRTVYSIVAVAVLFVMSLAVNLQRPPHENAVYLNDMRNNQCIIFGANGKYYLASPLTDVDAVNRYLTAHKIRDVEGVVLTAAPKSSGDVKRFLELRDVKVLWIPYFENMSVEIYLLPQAQRIFVNTTVGLGGDITLSLLASPQKYFGFVLSGKRSTVLVPKGIALNTWEFIAASVPKSDLVIGQPRDGYDYREFINVIYDGQVLGDGAVAEELYQNRYFTFLL